MATKKPPLTEKKIAEMYSEWMQGSSVRTVAKRHGYGRMTVHPAFRKQYGQDACNLRKRSLARVIVKEYGDVELAEKALGVEGLYRSAKTERNYSRFQTVNLEEYNISYHETEDLEIELNLSAYLWISEMTLSIIDRAMVNQKREIDLAIFVNRYNANKTHYNRRTTA